MQATAAIGRAARPDRDQGGMTRRHGCGRRLALAATLVAAGAASAAGFNVVAGPSATPHRPPTLAAFASVFGDTPAGVWRVEPVATLGWVRARRSTDTDPGRAVWLAGAGARLVSRSNHWFASVQLARSNAQTQALSSRWEFIDSIGWQDDHLTATIRHLSDGHIVGGGTNGGETMLAVGLRW